MKTCLPTRCRGGPAVPPRADAWVGPYLSFSEQPRRGKETRSACCPGFFVNFVFLRDFVRRRRRVCLTRTSIQLAASPTSCYRCYTVWLHSTQEFERRWTSRLTRMRFSRNELKSSAQAESSRCRPR